MDNAVKITVAVPVYNTEKYLDRCLDSIRSQTFRELEILCIDDCSTDRSPEILRRHADADARIRIITMPENRGVANARNLAIDEARGEYLYYMDSDDWLDPEYLEAMYKHAEATGQDVVVNKNWYVEYDDPGKRHRYVPSDFIRGEAGYYAPETVQQRFYPVVWARLYKLQYIKDNKIRSPKMEGGVDDNYFTSLAEVLQPRSYIFGGPFYHYYQRTGSLSHGPDRCFQHLMVYREMTKAFRERGIPPSAASRFRSLNELRIDDADRFALAHAFFTEVEPDMMAAPQLYYSYDFFLMKVLTTCPDYRTFRRRYFPYMKTNWRLRILWYRKWPTAEDVLTRWKY